MSKTLLRTVPLQVILSVDKFTMNDSDSREEKTEGLNSGNVNV